MREKAIILERTVQEAVMSQELDQILLLMRNPDSDVRYHACGLLHEMGDKRVVPELLRLLKEDRDVQVRGIVAYALGGIGDMQALCVNIE